MYGDDKHNKKNNKSIRDISVLFKKSVGINKNLKKGYILKKSDLCLKKPGTGINHKDIKKCIGKKILRDIKADEILNYKDLSK